MARYEKPSYPPFFEAFQELIDIPKIEQTDAQVKEDKMAKLEIRKVELDVEAKEQIIEARETHSRFVLRVIIAWLAVVLGIVILSGFCPRSFHITEKTLIVLIGSTTANVLGFYVIILKYFFH